MPVNGVAEPMTAHPHSRDGCTIRLRLSGFAVTSNNHLLVRA
jgi:hypothetical protein